MLMKRGKTKIQRWNFVAEEWGDHRVRPKPKQVVKVQW